MKLVESDVSHGSLKLMDSENADDKNSFACTLNSYHSLYSGLRNRLIHLKSLKLSFSVLLYDAILWQRDNSSCVHLELNTCIKHGKEM